MSIPNLYTHRYSISAADMDKDYRLTPSAVLLYYQDCWARFMAVHHIAAFDLKLRNEMWVITEFNASFEQMDIFWSEDIDVTVWDSELTPLRLYSDFRIKKSGTDIIVAEGYACWNLLDTDNKKIVRVDELAEQPDLVADFTLGEHKKMRIASDGELIRTVKHKVNQLDLDFNGHVNNRSYLSIAMLTAPDDFIHSYLPKRMHMQWVHETFLGDEIQCELRQLEQAQGVEQGENEYTHMLYNSEEKCVAKIYSVWGVNGSKIGVRDVAPRN